MGNCLRFIRYTFRVAFRTKRAYEHQMGFLRQHGISLMAGAGCALMVTMPVWMILLGII